MKEITLEEAFEGYKHEVEMRSNSAEGWTVRAYSSCLRRFFNYLKEKHDVEISSPSSTLSPRQAIDFITYLDEENLSASAMNLYMVALTDFFGFLVAERLLAPDPDEMEAMRRRFRQRRRKKSRRLPKDYSDEIMSAVISAARAIPPGDEPYMELIRLRDIAIVETLRCSGMRVGELVGMRRGDLNPENLSADIIGKGGKQRRVFFDEAAWRAIQIYLKVRNDGASGQPLHLLPVFARHDRRARKRVLPLSVRSVDSIIKRLVALADLPEGLHLTPHSFRHYFATRFLAETRDLATVQDALGHSSPSTTRIYARVRPVDLEESYRKVWRRKDK
ncbi:MAG: tyrosine-type recombinase/integrase [Anaerolineae bacterium]